MSFCYYPGQSLETVRKEINRWFQRQQEGTVFKNTATIVGVTRGVDNIEVWYTEEL